MTSKLFYDCRVKDVKTVRGFLKKYYKLDRYIGRGEEYAATLLTHYLQDFKMDGFVVISHHDSVTGKVVALYKE